MLLNELFSTAVKAEVVTATNTNYAATATIGDRKINFYGSRTDQQGNTRWSVSFYEERDGGETFQQTHSGNELEVFSMVLECIRDVIRRYEPDYIDFTAEKHRITGKANRAALYTRLIKRFQVPGYSVSKIDDQYGTSFEMEHDGAKAKHIPFTPEEQAEYDMFFKRPNAPDPIKQKIY